MPQYFEQNLVTSMHIIPRKKYRVPLKPNLNEKAKDKIRQELNQFKLTEMCVAPSSQHFTNIEDNARDGELAVIRWTKIKHYNTLLLYENKTKEINFTLKNKTLEEEDDIDSGLDVSWDED